ncbi:MAG: hypothetical protein EAZ35_02210 [Sphingobacteriia bacterium]|nr:MAG: hypothetical protein EAZ35_02210 [Sphingobacteriia bacterium]
MGLILNINGKQYTGADLNIALFGAIEDEVKSISYNYERKHVHNESLKGLTSWSMGAISNPTCNIELFMTAVARIELIARSSGVGDITLLKPFPIVISYINDDLREVVDIVTCKFQAAGRKVENPVDGISQSFDMFVTGLVIGS